MRAFSYVETADTGAAPNFQPPFTTFAICKPKIRQTAQIGDLIIGFSGRPLGPDPHSVRWAGVVREKLSFARYWSDPRFAGKKPSASNTPDNIYEPSDAGFVQVTNGIHGCDSMVRDLGGQFVLVLDPAWHFGPAAPNLPERFGLRVNGGRRAHRVCELSPETWLELQIWLNAQKVTVGPTKHSLGNCVPPLRPRSVPQTRRC